MNYFHKSNNKQYRMLTRHITGELMSAGQAYRAAPTSVVYIAVLHNVPPFVCQAKVQMAPLMTIQS